MFLSVVTWTGGGDATSWSDARNWSSNPLLPGTADDVAINAGTNTTVQINAGAQAVNSVVSTSAISVGGGSLSVSAASQAPSLSLSSGTLGGSGDFKVTGTFDWTGGTMSGSGRTIVPAVAVLNIGGVGTTKTLSRLVENDGSATWTGGTLAVSDGRFENNGSFTANSAGLLDSYGAPGVNAFDNNAGASFVQAGTGTTRFFRSTSDVAFNNAGSVAVQGGTLALDSGGTHAGTFALSGGTTLRLGGSQTFGTGSGVSGSGTLNVAGGTADFSAAPVSAGALTIAGGTTTFGRPFVAAGALTISLGTVNFNANSSFGSAAVSGGAEGGSGAVTVTGAFDWSGGTIGAARTTVGGAGTLNLTDGIPKTLTGVLEIDVAATWSGGSLEMNGGTVENNGVFTAAITGPTLGCYGAGGVNAFNNNAGATFNQTGTAPTRFRRSTTDVAFNNAGFVSVQAGTLSLEAGGTHSGRFAVAGAATLDLYGTQTFGSAATVSGAGTLEVLSGTATFDGSFSMAGTLSLPGGTARFNGADSFGSVTLNGGTLDGSGDLTVTGTLAWSLGTMAGSGRTIIASGGGTNILGPETRVLSRVLVNNGSASWIDGRLEMAGGRIENNGTFTANSAGALNSYGAGGVNAFNNNANARFVQAGTGTTRFFRSGTDSAFNNAGSVSIQAGMLALDAGGTHAGSFTLSGGATLRLDGPHTFGVGAAVSGAGTLNVAGGSAAFGGPFAGVTSMAVSGNATATLSGSFNVTAMQVSDQAQVNFSAPATMDTLGMSGGTVTVGAAQAGGGARPATSGDVVVVSLATQGVFSGGTVRVLPGARLDTGGPMVFTGGDTAIQLSSDNSLPGTLKLGGDVQMTGGTASITSSGTGSKPGAMDLGGVARTFSVNDGPAAVDMRVSAAVSNGGVRTSGGGWLQLAATNGYAGGTTIAGGTLEADVAGALGAGTVDFKGGTLAVRASAPLTLANPLSVSPSDSLTIDVGAATVQVPGMTLGAALNINGTGTLVVGGNVTLQADATINNAANVTLNGVIGGAFGISKTLGGTLTLGGASPNTYSGLTTVYGGTLALNNTGNALAVPGALNVNGPAVVRWGGPGEVSAGATVHLNSVPGAALLDLNGQDQSIASLTLTGGGGVAGGTLHVASAVNGSGAFTVGGGGGSLPASVTAPGLGVTSLTINASGSVSLPPNAAVPTTSTVAGLTVQPGGVLDLGNNALLLSYPAGPHADVVAAVRTFLANGYNGGGWDGGPSAAGVITSATARTNPPHNTGIAWVDWADGTKLNPTANSILLKYAVIGDTDLDGTVGLSDYTNVVRNFGVGTSWDQGAVTYGATVGLADYTAVVRNFGQSAASPARAASTVVRAETSTAVAPVKPAEAPQSTSHVRRSGRRPTHR